jgi:hypothetical protein
LTADIIIAVAWNNMCLNSTSIYTSHCNSIIGEVPSPHRLFKKHPEEGKMARKRRREPKRYQIKMAMEY